MQVGYVFYDEDAVISAQLVGNRVLFVTPYPRGIYADDGDLSVYEQIDELTGELRVAGEVVF